MAGRVSAHRPSPLWAAGTSSCWTLGKPSGTHASTIPSRIEGCLSTSSFSQGVKAATRVTNPPALPMATWATRRPRGSIQSQPRAVEAGVGGVLGDKGEGGTMKLPAAHTGPGQPGPCRGVSDHMCTKGAWCRTPAQADGYRSSLQGREVQWVGVWPREELRVSLKAMWAPCSANSSSVPLSRETGRHEEGTGGHRLTASRVTGGRSPRKSPGWQEGP